VTNYPGLERKALMQFCSAFAGASGDADVCAIHTEDGRTGRAQRQHSGVRKEGRKRRDRGEGRATRIHCHLGPQRGDLEVNLVSMYVGSPKKKAPLRPMVIGILSLLSLFFRYQT
jgi:hypothetical protein